MRNWLCPREIFRCGVEQEAVLLVWRQVDAPAGCSGGPVNARLRRKSIATVTNCDS
jgi:hypothetical protein